MNLSFSNTSSYFDASHKGLAVRTISVPVLRAHWSSTARLVVENDESVLLVTLWCDNRANAWRDRPRTEQRSVSRKIEMGVDVDEQLGHD